MTKVEQDWWLVVTSLQSSAVQLRGCYLPTTCVCSFVYSQHQLRRSDSAELSSYWSDTSSGGSVVEKKAPL